jgi:hypothetical protein
LLWERSVAQIESASEPFPAACCGELQFLTEMDQGVNERILTCLPAYYLPFGEISLTYKSPFLYPQTATQKILTTHQM